MGNEQNPTNIERGKSEILLDTLPPASNSGRSCFIWVSYYSPLNFVRALGTADGLQIAVTRDLLIESEVYLGMAEVL